ncbi:superoxide dismutase [Candidatus Woesearchaeota archaeon]|nr:superoxide dismutase [Candidatus Woesearchaeota archaeon]
MYKAKRLEFSPKKLKGISEKQIKLHHDKHYVGYVNKRNKIENKLKKGDLDHIRELKKGESHNASGMILHEIYFDCLGGKGLKPKGDLMKKINEDFGSYAKWKKEFKACATAARGWVLLCYDWRDHKLHNYVVDFHDGGAVWGAAPIMAMDMWEHAYYLDFGPEKTKYVDAFFKNIDWSKVEEMFERYTEE